MGGDEKRDESALGTTGDGGVSALGASGDGAADALGSFGTGAGMRDMITVSGTRDGLHDGAYVVEGTVTGRWVDEAVQNGQPPSIRATAYVNRETARKLLQGMVKEFREQARVSIACGFDDDAERYEEWATQCEACLGLTLGGG